KTFSMTEWSVVGVPSCAGAIRDSLDSEKSFMSPRLQKALQPYCATAKGCWNGWCPCPPSPAKEDAVSKTKGHDCGCGGKGATCSCHAKATTKAPQEFRLGQLVELKRPYKIQNNNLAEGTQGKVCRINSDGTVDMYIASQEGAITVKPEWIRPRLVQPNQD